MFAPLDLMLGPDANRSDTTHLDDSNAFAAKLLWSLGHSEAAGFRETDRARQYLKELVRTGSSRLSFNEWVPAWPFNVLAAVREVVRPTDLVDFTEIELCIGWRNSPNASAWVNPHRVEILWGLLRSFYNWIEMAIPITGQSNDPYVLHATIRSEAAVASEFAKDINEEWLASMIGMDAGSAGRAAASECDRERSHMCTMVAGHAFLFVLLHELGHIVLRHRPTEDLIESKIQEHEADEFAIRQIGRRDSGYSAIYACLAISIIESMQSRAYGAAHATRLESLCTHPLPSRRRHIAVDEAIECSLDAGATSETIARELLFAQSLHLRMSDSLAARNCAALTSFCSPWSVPFFRMDRQQMDDHLTRVGFRDETIYQELWAFHRRFVDGWTTRTSRWARPV